MDSMDLQPLKESLPDLIISDLQMPNMNGFEFLSVIRQRFPHLPVIVISGEFSGIDVPNSVLADTFFEKSQYHAGRLVAQIADLVRKGTNPSLATGKLEYASLDSTRRERPRRCNLHELPTNFFRSDATCFRQAQCRLRILLVHSFVPIAINILNRHALNSEHYDGCCPAVLGG